MGSPIWMGRSAGTCTNDITPRRDFTTVLVLAELGVPEGQVVDKYRGGEGMLRRVFEDVKKYAFSGLVRLTLELNGDRAEGAIAFNSGEPVLALYEYRKAGPGRPERSYKGAKAVEFIWEDSLLQESIISLHSRVLISELERKFPDAKVTRVELMPPSSLTNPRTVGETQKLAGKSDEVALKVQEWSREGYNVGNLIRLYTNDPSSAARSLPYFEANIQRLQGLEEILRFLDTVGYEREAESLMRKMRDPEKVLEVETELEELRRRIEGYEEEQAEAEIKQDLERKRVDEKIDSVYDLILQYHQQTTAPEQAMKLCRNCGGTLDSKGHCVNCAPPDVRSAFGRTLNPRFSFEMFVSGPGNKFAEAAARAVAENPGKSFNPLFLYSRSGLGKTHLMQAIGNHIGKERPQLKVISVPTEAFEAELIDAVGSNRLDDMRKAYRKVDILLLDDVQFLAGKERIQEELFQTFTAIVDHGGQIVLTSDRQPKEIPSLSERLVTRFESGLIADMQAPDLETRLAILDRRIKAQKLNIPKDVAGYIAEVCKDNVRQLEGGLNRVVAFTSLMHSKISLELAQEILKYEVRVPKRAAPKTEVLDGHSYLFEEEKPDLSHRMLVSKAKEGYKALAIVRGHPKSLLAKLSGTEARVLWLTDRESKTEKTVPPSLERLMLIIESFITENKRAIILLDDIQFLISNTAFEGVVRFLRTVVDEVSEKESIFVVSLNPESLKVQERSILEREMEVLRSKND